MRLSQNSLVRTLPLCALLMAAACQSTPKEPQHAEVRNEQVAQATVQSIDRDIRGLVLERADGVRIGVLAGPEVQNFDQISVGDTVTARYVETVAVRQLAADEVAAEPAITLAAGRAEARTKPGAALGAGLSLTVTVESLDKENNTVVFTDPEGTLHALQPERDEGRAFLKALKVGDRVEMVFTEQVALSIE